MAAKRDLELEKRGKITTNYTVHICVLFRNINIDKVVKSARGYWYGEEALNSSTSYMYCANIKRALVI